MESEREGLAPLPAAWAPLRSAHRDRPHRRNHGDASLWRALRLDQHGAGRRTLSPPWIGDAADAARDAGARGCRPRAGSRRNSGRPSGLSRYRLSGLVGVPSPAAGAAGSVAIRRGPAGRSSGRNHPADQRRRLVGAVRVRCRRFWRAARWRARGAARTPAASRGRSLTQEIASSASAWAATDA